MEISLIKGTPLHIPACVDALMDSDLGRHYFPGHEQATNAVLEFMGCDHFLVAIDEADRWVGFLCYLPTGAFHAYPYLHLLVVSPPDRGRGFGSRLMDAFEGLIAKGKDKVFLVVSDFNPHAHKFYEKRGYREVGVVPSLYRLGIDEHLMMKSLASPSFDRPA